MVCLIGAGPVRRMGVVDPVAGLTTGTIETVYAEVKTGITPWSAGLAMACLANPQVSLGIRPMICSFKIAGIHRMRGLARTVWIFRRGAGRSAGTCRQGKGQKQQKQWKKSAYHLILLLCHIHDELYRF